jgi:hypothetical protein
MIGVLHESKMSSLLTTIRSTFSATDSSSSQDSDLDGSDQSGGLARSYSDSESDGIGGGMCPIGVNSTVCVLTATPHSFQ